MVNVAADNTTEGERPGVSRSDNDTWFEHPRQLKRLFTTEMWERFGFYGMRALLTLYLAQHFLFSDQTTTGLYGGFTALVYLTPLIGGLLADRYLGSKRSVKFGAVLMALGYFTLCFGGDAAKPYALVDGQRYEVQIDRAAEGSPQYLVAGDQRLQIRGNDDKSVSLLATDGTETRRIAAGGFESQGERSSFFTMLLLAGLSMVTIGNGFFKPNISTIVGSLYAEGDRRRDAGFTIFYMGINLGSLISQFFCPLLYVWVGPWAGFGLAALGMLFSWVLIQFDGGRLNGYGERPAGVGGERDMIIYISAIAAVPVVWFLFSNLMNYVAPEAGSGIVGYILSLPIMGKVLFGTFLIGVPAILIWSWRNGSRAEFQMMVAAMVLIIFNVVFWTLFEQAGSSLTLFADRNTDLAIQWTGPLFAMFRAAPITYYLVAILLAGGISALAWWFFAFGEPRETKRTMGFGFLGLAAAIVVGLHFAREGLSAMPVYIMPAGQTQIFNALFIVLLAPVFGILWNVLAKRGVEPTIPVKFAIALMGVGAGFLFLVWGAASAGPDFKVGLAWLAGLYLIHSIAELCISPVGLSMITKLSIARIVGMMMGVWFLSISVAQYVAGIVAQVASVETVGGQVTNLKVSLDTYSNVFWTIGLVSAGIGLLLLLLSPLLKKWMHGVK
ncbi:peptide MFS transporter [Allosphingosinicella deserti]|uniref:MFS transporter n=1 Tax=Allosphingosinicella deserti TaxID=2116704 RepID=A0A2P7QY44_9SPHN|nr:peptide MFS transporter [Sphingomonas deserti]PSJ42892.1 MFS transporter [Sphingomonas deserti]